MEKNSIFFLGVNLFLLLIEKSENWWKEVGDGSFFKLDRHIGR